MNRTSNPVLKARGPAACFLLALLVLGQSGAALARERVPFRGRLEAVVTRGQPEPPFVPVLIEGTGNGTQLGQFEYTSPHRVNTSTRIATGSCEFIAANGDTLAAVFTGRASPTATPGVLHIVEIATITGGTGRFEGATGSFIVQREYDTAAGTTSGSFEGTLSSPGKSHP